MYKLNIKNEVLGDFIIIFLLDNLLDNEFYKNNENFNDIITKMENKGFKSSLFIKYFDLDPSIRSKYKIFKKKIEEGVIINIDKKE